jgi:hypothetical protein
MISLRYRPVTDRYRYSPFFWKFNLLFIAVLKKEGFWLNYEKNLILTAMKKRLNFQKNGE